MPRLSNVLPKYRKHRSSGQAIVTLNGRDFYLGPHGTKVSKFFYDRLIGEWLANGRRPLTSTDDLLVVELCLRYWKFAKSYYQKNGRSTGVTLHEVPLSEWHQGLITMQKPHKEGMFLPLAKLSLDRLLLSRDTLKVGVTLPSLSIWTFPLRVSPL